MKLNLYSVFDRVAEVFNKPFTEINDQSAERAFKESLEESKHAKDYDLYKLADFTDHDGLIVHSKEYPKRLYSGLAAKK